MYQSCDWFAKFKGLNLFRHFQVEKVKQLSFLGSAPLIILSMAQTRPLFGCEKRLIVSWLNSFKSANMLSQRT